MGDTTRYKYKSVLRRRTQRKERQGVREKGKSCKENDSGRKSDEHDIPMIPLPVLINECDDDFLLLWRRATDDMQSVKFAEMRCRQI